MPNPVYRTEITFAGITVVGPALSATEFGTRPSVFFSAYDDTNEWAIEARLAYHAYSSLPVLYEYRAEFYFYHLTGAFMGDPATGSFVAGTFSLVDADGNNGAPITAGFTLAIEKDFDSDALRFVTPLGTVTHTLTSFGALDLSALRLDSVAHQFVRSNTGADGQDNWGWQNAYSKQDGTNFLGAALTTGAPGIWSLWTDVTFGFPVGSIVRSTNAQDPTRYDTAMFYAAADGVRSAGNRQWRVWLGGDTVDATLGGSVVDMTEAPEHGRLWAAYPDPASATTLKARDSDDKGGHWREVTVAMAAAAVQAPSINWYAGRLYAVWQQGASIVQAVSLDLGTTWSTPVTLALTGTSPRHLVHPKHGLSFYFFCDGADLKVRRSGNFGTEWIDGAPILVAAGIGAQTVAAQVAPDGSLIVGYISGGAWQQVRSSDLGVTWS